MSSSEQPPAPVLPAESGDGGSVCSSDVQAGTDGSPHRQRRSEHWGALKRRVFSEPQFLS